MMKPNLALVSPNLNAYSETFIQKHRLMDANVKYYYGGHIPTHLEGKGALNPPYYNCLKYHIKEIIGKVSPPNLLINRAIVRSFKENEIDIVYAEYGPTGVALLSICQELNIPLIVNFHGYDTSMHSVVETYRDDYKLMFKYSSAIVVVSRTMERKILELGCPPKKIKYLVYAPSDTFFKINPKFSEESFLSVGRFVDKKAPYYTIMAMKKVVEKYPDAKLYMAGDGVLFNACQNLVSSWRLSKNIIMLGVQNHHQLLPLYEKVTGFVQHSVTAQDGDMEGTPVGILEASAAALPVVSTYHAGIPDIIIDGKTGLLVDGHDVEGMAEKMLSLLDNKQKAIEMGMAGRENIRNNYSLHQHLEFLNSIINQL